MDSGAIHIIVGDLIPIPIPSLKLITWLAAPQLSSVPTRKLLTTRSHFSVTASLEESSLVEHSSEIVKLSSGLMGELFWKSLQALGNKLSLITTDNCVVTTKHCQQVDSSRVL